MSDAESKGVPRPPDPLPEVVGIGKPDGAQDRPPVQTTGGRLTRSCSRCSQADHPGDMRRTCTTCKRASEGIQRLYQEFFTDWDNWLLSWRTLLTLSR